MTHPLDPCTGDELTTAVSTLRAAGSLSERAFFSAGWAAEPSRADVARHEAGEPVERQHPRAPPGDRDPDRDQPANERDGDE